MIIVSNVVSNKWNFVTFSFLLGKEEEYSIRKKDNEIDRNQSWQHKNKVKLFVKKVKKADARTVQLTLHSQSPA